MDIQSVRSRFSGLASDFVFLDAPGGSQVPDEVGVATSRVFAESSGNVGAPYETSRRIEALVDDVRSRSAGFLGCSVDEIIFGANMTSLNFTLSRTLGRTLAEGDEIIVTRLDHDGNVSPWLELARDRNLTVHLADVHDDTTLNLEDITRFLGPRTRVVAFPWAANTVGTIVDAAAVAALAHEAGALAWVDAVQYAPHHQMDVAKIDADVLLCSSYKFCGPHLGIAYGRKELLESWRPYKARPASMEPIGHRFETGTLPYELLAALGATYDYLDSIGGFDEIERWERKLGEHFLAGLTSEARLYGLRTMRGRVPTFLLNFEGISSDELSRELGARGFGVWSNSNYYALGLHERIGWGEALRVGLAHYNTVEEIDRFHEELASLTKGAHSSTIRPRMSVGDKFPVTALAKSGTQMTRPAAIYFYPKDGTEVCSRETAAFQRHRDEYVQAGLDIIGISTDTEESHRSFARDQGVVFDLVSDEDHSIAEQVGVMEDFGEYGVLAGRVTFLLDGDGTIREVFEVDGDVTSHPADVIAAARRLGLVSDMHSLEDGRPS